MKAKKSNSRKRNFQNTVNKKSRGKPLGRTLPTWGDSSKTTVSPPQVGNVLPRASSCATLRGYQAA